MKKLNRVLALTLLISILTTTSAFAAPNYEIRSNVKLGLQEWGIEDTVNLVSTITEYINFDAEMELNVKDFKDGNYNVEIWDEDTYKIFSMTNWDAGGVITGLLYKKPNGELSFYKGSLSLEETKLFNGLYQRALGRNLIRLPRNTTEVAEYGVSDWNIMDGNQTKTTQPTLPTDNKELYGYILHSYDYMGEEEWSADLRAGKSEEERYKIDFTNTLELFKFPVNQTKTETPVTATAIPTASKVIVDGKEIEFDAYTINNNYFKLRDIGMALNEKDTQGQYKGFSLRYMNDFDILVLNSYSYYNPAGGELTKGDGKAKTATLNNKSLIYKDTDFITPTAYNINGNNFFKLRDLMEVFDYGVEFDSTANAIIIDTTKSYDGSPRDYNPFNPLETMPK